MTHPHNRIIFRLAALIRAFAALVSILDYSPGISNPIWNLFMNVYVENRRMELKLAIPFGISAAS